MNPFARRPLNDPESLAPQRPSNTEDPNARAPKDRTPLDYATNDDVQPTPEGFVPSAPEPVPVYIVQTAPARRPLTRRSSGNITVAATNVYHVSGVDTRRTRAWFRNLDTANPVWILNDAIALPILGILLEAGQDVELHDTDELWIRAGELPADVTWSLEYEVDE